MLDRLSTPPLPAHIAAARQGEQMLTLIRRTSEGFEEEHLQRVSFVPLLENVD